MTVAQSNSLGLTKTYNGNICAGDSDHERPSEFGIVHQLFTSFRW